MQPQRRKPRGSCLITALLVLAAISGVALIIAGAAAALFANSPANRAGNSYAGVGVAFGAGVCVLGIILIVLCFAGAAVRGRRR